ncbi:M56 family metallopeptidase [Clostridium sp. JNZ X4-2]
MLILSVFKFILYSSIIGSIFAILILILRFLFKKNLQIKLINFIWLFLVLRLLIPFAPQTSFSIYNLFNNKIVQHSVEKNFTEDIQTSNKLPNKTSDILNNPQPIKFENTAFIQNNLSSRNKIFYLEMSAFIWMWVCIILIAFTTFTTLEFYIKLRKIKTTEDNKLIDIVNRCRQKMHINKHLDIISTDIVKNPGIFGFIHPKILLPSNINDVIDSEQLSCVIFHELSHLKRKDTILNFIVSLLRIIHWFNPLLLYAFSKMKEDKELACDEMALNYCSHKKYGYTIIKLLEVYQKSNTIYGMDFIINNKYEIKRRITMISLFKKNSHRWTALSIAILVIIGGIMLTDPKIHNTSAAEKNTKNNLSGSINESSVQGKNFNGKMLIIKDPSTIKIGYTKELLKNNKTTGELAEENKALYAVNANLIPTESEKKSFVNSSQDGLIIHNGNIIYDSPKNAKYNIAGFTDKNTLVSGQYSVEALKKMNVTEAVNSSLSLIENGKPLLGKYTMSGINSRTAIAQKKDGTVIMVVIDGRNTNSIGISLFELQQLLLKEGAYTAAVLDGGSSSTMYYKDGIINKPAYSKGQLPVSSIFMVK